MNLIDTFSKNKFFVVSTVSVCLAFLCLHLYLPPELAEELPPDLVSGKIVIQQRAVKPIYNTLRFTSDPTASENNMVAYDSGGLVPRSGDHKKVYLNQVDIDLANGTITLDDRDWFILPYETIRFSPDHSAYVIVQPNSDNDNSEFRLYSQHGLVIKFEFNNPLDYRRHRNGSWSTDGRKYAFRTEDSIYIASLDGTYHMAKIPVDIQKQMAEFTWSTTSDSLFVHLKRAQPINQLTFSGPEKILYGFHRASHSRRSDYVRDTGSQIRLTYYIYQDLEKGQVDEQIRLESYDTQGNPITTTDIEMQQFELATGYANSIDFHKNYAVILENSRDRSEEDDIERSDLILHVIDLQTEEISSLFTFTEFNHSRDPFFIDSFFMLDWLTEMISWSPISDEFVFADSYGRLHLFDAATKGHRILTDKPLLFGHIRAGQVDGFEVATWSPDGRYLAAVGRYRFAQSAFAGLRWLHIIEIATGKIYRVGEPLGVYDILPSAAGTTFMSVRWEAE